ncbi:MAG: hypothetical protein ABIJ65_11790 [Chloroflexota bacterium]
MQKWEYCAITGILHSGRNLSLNYPAIWRFTKTGWDKTDIKGDEMNLVAKNIAELGEQGWEMVGTGPLDEGRAHILYFKRPKE